MVYSRLLQFLRLVQTLGTYTVQVADFGYYISNGGRFGRAGVHNLMDRALSECGVLDDWRQPAALSNPGMRQDDASNLTRELLELIIQVHAQGRIFGECFCTDANNHMLGDDRDLCNGYKALAELRAR
jgi:hypothetical protein